MSTATVLEFLLHSAENRAQEPRRPDTFGPVPELPRPSQRWTVRRKAAVVEAVRGGWMPTRYQIYRDTDKRAPAVTGTAM